VSIFELVRKHKRFILFLAVGGLNTLFGYSIFSLFVYFGLHYTLAVLLATCFGTLFNFQTTGRLVFKNSDHRLLFRFLLVYVVQYFANISLIKMFLIIFTNVYISGAVATFICAVLSYLLMKNFVFMVRERHETN